MNILLVCHFGLYENLSFSFVHNQAREFAKLGHKVRVICPIGVGKRDRAGKRLSLLCKQSTVDDVTIFDIRYLTLSSFGEKKFNIKSAITSIKFCKNFLGGFVPDIIHAHTLGFDSRIGAWLKKNFNCPLVVTTHGSDTELPLASGNAQQLCKDCDEADAIVAVSSKLANRLLSCGTQTPVYSIVNGFVPRSFSNEIVRDPMRIIQVGNLIPLKNVDVTIKAFSQLKKIHPAMTLTVVGQGPEREKLELLCNELNVAESVTFTGQLDNAKVFEEMRKSTFFVMVSKPEGFGIVYLEAMAAGCITIGTKGEGIDGTIVHHENGFLVNANSPEIIAEIIDKCISDTVTASQIALNGKRTAENLTWLHNAEKTMQIYNLLLRG